jgi:DNA-binding NtrC family response regulator
MKIAIFENQYQQVKEQFDIVKRIFFKDQLEIEQYNSSQQFKEINKISEYSLFIIDISLSSNSDKDGYNLISKILKIPNHPPIIILTGNYNIESGLKEMNLPNLPIIEKPVDPIDIYNKIKEVLKLE